MSELFTPMQRVAINAVRQNGRVIPMEQCQDNLHLALCQITGGIFFLGYKLLAVHALRRNPARGAREWH